MEKEMIVGAVLLFILAVGAAAGASQEGIAAPSRDGSCCEEQRSRRHRPMPELEEALGLTEAQQAKVQALLQTERAKSAAILKRVRETREELRKTEETESFDEKAIRAAAAREGELMAQLTVLHAKTRHEIRTLLSSEQRSLLEKLRPVPGLSPAPFPPPPGTRRPFPGSFPQTDLEEGGD